MTLGIILHVPVSFDSLLTAVQSPSLIILPLTGLTVIVRRDSTQVVGWLAYSIG